MPLLFFTRAGEGGVGMREKIKPLVWSNVRFMESFYSPPPDHFYISVLGLIGKSGFAP